MSVYLLASWEFPTEACTSETSYLCAEAMQSQKFSHAVSVLVYLLSKWQSGYRVEALMPVTVAGI